MKTIEPAIQEAILNLLPDDGKLAWALVCQLLANMVLSIEGVDVPSTMVLIKAEFDALEGT